MIVDPPSDRGVGFYFIFIFIFLATLRMSRSWAAKQDGRWKKNSWWVSCSRRPDGMGRRDGRELVGAIEKTTAEAGGYQHCIKRNIFFGLWQGDRDSLEEKLTEEEGIFPLAVGEKLERVFGLQGKGCVDGWL